MWRARMVFGMSTITTLATLPRTTKKWKLFAPGATTAGSDDAKLLDPLRWRKPQVVSPSDDLFHKDVPFEFIDKVFAVMALCPHLTFQILTKRPERAAEYLNARPGLTRPQLIGLDAVQVAERHCPRASRNASWAGTIWPLPNVWLGTSAEDQKAADERIPHLLRCPAAVRFLSCEPLLGQVGIDMPYWCCKRCGNPFPPGADPEDDASWEPYPEWENGCPRCGVPNYVDASWLDHDNIHWVIVGGESGPGRREMRLEWLESIVQQCQAAGVPVFVKQASGPRPGMQGGIPDRVWNLKQFPEGV